MYLAVWTRCCLCLSCRRASSRCSIVISVVVDIVIVGLDVNIIRGVDTLSKPFVPLPRLLPLLRCHCHHCPRRRYHCCRHSLFSHHHRCHRNRCCSHRRCCPCHCCCHSSSLLLSLSCHHRCRCCHRHHVWLIVTFAVNLHLSPPSPLPIASATTQCRYLVVLCCIATADTSLMALPPLSLFLSCASWLLNC
jgi:hypothetical protein